MTSTECVQADEYGGQEKLIHKAKKRAQQQEMKNAKPTH